MNVRSDAATVPTPRAREAVARCRTVLMVGTDLTTMGGIRAVVQGYRDAGLFRRANVLYVATHRDGTRLQKARTAVTGWLVIAWRLATLDAPLLHVHLASRASFWRKSVVCLMARALRRPYLLHVHGGAFLRFYEHECGPLAQGFIRRIFADAVLVLALTEEWRTRLSRISARARIEVLQNGVALPAMPERAGDGSPRLLFLGQLSRAKGVHDLLHAFARLPVRPKPWTLVCAGGGAIDEIRALAVRLRVDARVECTGWLHAQAKRRELATAAAFVLPSYTEGLPMALLEAMSWGLPVVTTPVGGIPQVIEHGRNGVLVFPGDIDGLASALAQLSDAGHRARLGAAARATIETRFSLDASLERLIQIYHSFGIVTS
ncbi:MAG: glycosyltransferase family 4 protein [Steroidobacteraceae bacterium]